MEKKEKTSIKDAFATKKSDLFNLRGGKKAKRGKITSPKAGEREREHFVIHQRGKNRP